MKVVLAMIGLIIVAIVFVVYAIKHSNSKINNDYDNWSNEEHY